MDDATDVSREMGAELESGGTSESLPNDLFG
jgi:hypothetical protein